MSIVNTLAKFIHAQSQDSPSDDNDRLIIAAFHCMLDWIMADQWLVKDSVSLFFIHERVLIDLA